MDNCFSFILYQKLHILVTPVPSFGTTRVSRFDTRQDLIKANMASVHLVSTLCGSALLFNYIIDS